MKTTVCKNEARPPGPDVAAGAAGTLQNLR
jgi:hypothetical protein